MAFVEVLPRTVTIKGKEYNEIRFNGVLPKDTFRSYASRVLHANECVFANGALNKWFCPAGEVGYLIKQTDLFLEEAGEGATPELGTLIEKEYAKRYGTER